MLHTVSSYMEHGFLFLEKGFAHPSFLGRAVSWGIFYGALALIAKKVFDYVYPKFKDFWDSRNKCTCQHETPTGEIVLTDRKEPPEKPMDIIKEKGEPPTSNILSPGREEGEVRNIVKKNEN